MRFNQFVKEGRIKEARAVILAAEFNSNLPPLSLGQSGDSALLCKSHRPVCAFYSLGTGTDPYSSDDLVPSFVYGSQYGYANNYGLLPSKDIDDTPGVIEEGAGGPNINVVGRHHPGGDKLGGTTNFLYVDGHVARKRILETMELREWGTNFYSLTGRNTEIIGNR